MSQNEFTQVTDEFIQQNAAHAKRKKSVKRGGPYSINENEIRREEVRRLHFDYGYSARKIAELKKVNRNTINGDIDHWYSIILKDAHYINPVKTMVLYFEEMRIKKTRLRELLDKVNNNSERMAIERLMYEINSKILYTYQKLADSEKNTHKKAMSWLNNYMKKNKHPERYLTYYDIISVSDKSYRKIRKMIGDDRERPHSNKKF